MKRQIVALQFHCWHYFTCESVQLYSFWKSRLYLRRHIFYEMCVSAKVCTFLCERRPKPANKGVWCRCCGPGAHALSDGGDAILGAPRSSPTILFAPRVCKHLGVGEEGGSDCLNLLLFPQKRIKPTTVSLSLSLQTPTGYKDVYFFPSHLFQLSLTPTFGSNAKTRDSDWRRFFVFRKCWSSQ